MFDGFKIEVAPQVGEKWVYNDLLNFCSVFNESTGEIIQRKRWAKYRGLVFEITQSTLNENVFYYNITGSFHKYHNNGKHNYNTFSYYQFLKVLNDFETLFKLDLNLCYLHRLEFGLNVEFDYNAKKIVQNIQAYKNAEFVNFVGKGSSKIIGKKINSRRTETKIYNKTKQYNLKGKNIVRFEYVLKYYEVFRQNKITTLADLTDKTKVLPLINLLLNVWNDAIFEDVSVNYRALSNYTQKKYLCYLRANYWKNLNKVQRYRSKKHFFNIIAQHSTDQTQQKIGRILAQKWQVLTALFCTPLVKVETNLTAPFLYTFGNLIYTYQKCTNALLQKTEKEQKKGAKKQPNFKPQKTNKKTPKKRGCKQCKKDISHKQKNALYCCKKCNNKYNGKRRTMKRQKQRQTEKRKGQFLIPKIEKGKMWLQISHKAKGQIYSYYLHQSEIKTDYKTILQVQKVEINHRKNTLPIKLNSWCAKRIVNEINKFNHRKKRMCKTNK